MCYTAIKHLLPPPPGTPSTAGQSAFWQACPQQRAAAAAANLAGFEAVTKLCDGSGRGTASALAAPLGRFIEPSATIQ